MMPGGITKLRHLLADCQQCEKYREELRTLEAVREARRKVLGHMAKASLAVMHTRNGGLLSVAEYVKWRHEELVNEVLEDEGLS